MAPVRQPPQGGAHVAVGPVRLRAGELVAQDRDLVRSIRISVSFEVLLPARSASHPNNRTVSRWMRRRSTSAVSRSLGQMPCTSSGTPQVYTRRSEEHTSELQSPCNLV